MVLDATEESSEFEDGFQVLLRRLRVNRATSPANIPTAIDSTGKPGMPGGVVAVFVKDELVVVVSVLSNGLVIV